MNCLPGLGRLECGSLIASDEIISPMTPEIFSLDGLEILLKNFLNSKKKLYSKVVAKIIINSFNNRIKQYRDILLAASGGKFSV
ncbi:MAG: hypothetical protein JJE49_09330 [Peptostreptococcaceae bacterium]|nr:hypothetical protein [Peptostreptococcaceae bacterium]